MTAEHVLYRLITSITPAMLVWLSPVHADTPQSQPRRDGPVRSILESHCYDCHGNGENEGSLSLDGLLAMTDRDQAKPMWHAVLKQLQARAMPPATATALDDEQLQTLVDWIKYDAFEIDPHRIDPGHVTIRRLNQVEYRRSIRDLVGVDYDTSSKFPADDTGHGFDNIGDVLSLSPLLFEKYVNAAEEIISSAVPTVSGVVRRQSFPGSSFTVQTGSPEAAAATSRMSRRDELSLLYYHPAAARTHLHVDVAGDYVVKLNTVANESYVDNQFDDNRCELTVSLGGQPVATETLVRQGGKEYVFQWDRHLDVGPHELTVTITPLTQSAQIRQLRLEIRSVELIGPCDVAHYEKPARYDRFFPGGVPEAEPERAMYARKLLGDFAFRAFRRPVDDDSLDRLVQLARSIEDDGRSTFESGIAKAMTAVLASPRFVFREESIAQTSGDPFPQIDEFALASRLSYFLWSTTPDSELMELAAAGRLRDHLDQQIERMLRHENATALSHHFVGQWLRVRALETIQINAAAVLSREDRPIDPEADVRRGRFYELFRKSKRRTPAEEKEYEVERERFVASFTGGPRGELSPEVRDAMRLETELLFQHIVNNDLSLLELIDSDYTFLNAPLWAHYQIPGLPPIAGDQMRLVKLPAGSHRGGILTQGTMLVVTSNPDRTSPVKRGLFILENLLGVPPAAPPPNIPSLEDAAAGSDRPLSLRETLAVHRENSLCSSCHNKMDPLGLALENFNALGLYRTTEVGQPIDSAGELATGESFGSIDELKKILVTDKRSDLFRCVTEKMMTYALGRAVEPSDRHTLDEIVSMLDSNGGRVRSLIFAVIHSDAFQRTRPAGGVDPDTSVGRKPIEDQSDDVSKL